VTEASTHFVFQISGTVLTIVAVWIGLAGVLGITGDMGSGWQGRAAGTVALVGAAALFLVGKRLAIEHRIMRRRRD
jgi:hypothetical protein